jgi:hypothetical protein
VCWRPSWLGCLLDLDKWVIGEGDVLMGDGRSMIDARDRWFVWLSGKIQYLMKI